MFLVGKNAVNEGNIIANRIEFKWSLRIEFGLRSLSNKSFQFFLLKKSTLRDTVRFGSVRKHDKKTTNDSLNYFSKSIACTTPKDVQVVKYFIEHSHLFRILLSIVR